MSAIAHRWVAVHHFQRQVLPYHVPLVNRHDLLENLRYVRRNGFSVDNEEYQPGVVCIGAAIRDHAGAVIGAFSCSMPSMRANKKHLNAIENDVRATARILSDAVGATTE